MKEFQVKTYRRIEITAFRRRVIVGWGSFPVDITEAEVSLNGTDSIETIRTDSAEGQRILMEAVRLLEEKMSNG